MRLSVFTKAKALPSKEEKNVEARFSSKPYPPEVVDFSTEDDLIDIICNNCWSPFIFNGFRKQDNFVSTDLAVLDIDEGLKIEEAEEIVKDLGLTCLCLPTTSHSEELHKFRLIFPLSRTIRCKDVYAATMKKIGAHFPYDPACLTDYARFFFGSTTEDGFYFEADLLEPAPPEKAENDRRTDFNTRERVTVGETLEELVEKLYGEPRDEVPEPIAYFLENAPDNLSGEWFFASNRFLFTCGLSALDQETVEEVFFSLYPYDELTPQRVDKIYMDGYNSREEI